MSDTDRLAVHEAAHQVAAFVLGWELRGCTIEGGSGSDGCSRSLPPKIPAAALREMREHDDWPFLLWPEAVRRAVEGIVIQLMSGETAALLLRPKTGRYVLPVGDHALSRAAEVATAEPVAPHSSSPSLDVARLRADVNTPGPSDADVIGETIARMFLSDWHSAGAFLSWCEAQTRALVLAESERIERLALALLEYGTLTGSECIVILADE